jgi:hypothetical protein
MSLLSESKPLINTKLTMSFIMNPEDGTQFVLNLPQFSLLYNQAT